jgi:acetoin utilization protein AcuB
MPRQTVQKHMTISPLVISSRRTVADARQLMREKNIRHLPVVDGGNLVGIVSQRDLYLLETLKGIDPATETVGEAMTSDPYAVRPDTPLEVVARTMAEHKYGSAVVVDKGAVIGLFTTVDALRALANILKRGRRGGETEGAGP